MRNFLKTKNTSSQDQGTTPHLRQRFSLSSLEILFGSLIVMGLLYVGYFILFQESAVVSPKLEKRIKSLETLSAGQDEKIDKKIKAIQDTLQTQWEARLKKLEAHQSQLENANRELSAKIVRTQKSQAEVRRPATVKEKIEYKVKRGETFTTIAKKFKVSREDLARWNKTDKNRSVLIGETLIIYLP
jgi:LysM repeat protein